MMVNREDGNVTLITALSACLMLLVILFTTQIGQTATGASQMQGASDEAAVTAAAGYLSALNDITVLDALEWGVQALGNLGEALTVAGEVLIDLAAVTFGASAVIGGILVTVGEALSTISDTLLSVISPIVDLGKQVANVAKWVLAAANSTVIAAENGYFGFMIPADLGTIGPSTLNLDTVRNVVYHTEDIMVDWPIQGLADPSDVPLASIKTTLRMAALHRLWADARDTPEKDPVNPKQVLPAQPRGHQTFQLSTLPSPGCTPDSWQTVGLNALAPQDQWVQAPSNPTDPPDLWVYPAPKPGVTPSRIPPPIKRDCSDAGYLKQLVDQPYYQEYEKLRALKDQINKDGTWQGTSDELGQANQYIDQAQDDIRAMVDASHPTTCLKSTTTNTTVLGITVSSNSSCDSRLTPQPPPPSFSNALTSVFDTTHLPTFQNNADWVKGTVDNFNRGDVGSNCAKTPLGVTGAPNPPKSYGAGETFYDCGQVGYGLGNATLYQWWDAGTVGAKAPAPGDPGFTPHQAPGGPPSWDFRHRKDYHGSDLGAPKAYSNWLQGTTPAAKVGNDPANNPLSFVTFGQIGATTQSKISASLTGHAQPGDRWAIAGSEMQIVRTKNSNDLVNFSTLCGTIFGEDNPEDHRGDGFLGLPSTGGGWCVWLADAVINLAAVIGNLPGVFRDIIEAILGTPPDVHVWHVVLESMPGLPYACEIANDIHQGVQASKDPGSFLWPLIWDQIKSYAGSAIGGGSSGSGGQPPSNNCPTDASSASRIPAGAITS